MPADAAATLRAQFLHQPFGIIQFWGFGLVRPNDQMYVLVSVHQDGDRLDLEFVQEGGFGLPGVISIWAPTQVQVEGGTLTIADATRLRFDENEAEREGDTFRLKTARGEGRWPLGPKPALRLAH